LVEEAPAVCWIPWQSGLAVPRDAAPSEFAGGRERTGPSQLPARRPEVAFAIVSPLVAPSGQKTPFVLEIRNVTDQTIPIVFDDDPLAFAATASNEDATTLESDCSPIDSVRCPAFGGSIDGPVRSRPPANPGADASRETAGPVIGPNTRALRLFLRPHGAVRKTVTLDATQRVVRRREPDGACVEEDLGPLPPGNYTLEIALPASWLPTESDDRVDPFVRAPIRVTAAD
jgi:hypothetical protein